MELIIDESGTSGTLTLKKALSYDHVMDLKQILSNAMDQLNRIILDLDQLTGIDFSCLQLLFAAQKTCQQNHKSLLLKSLNPHLSQCIQDAGFVRFMIPVC